MVGGSLQYFGRRGTGGGREGVSPQGIGQLKTETVDDNKAKLGQPNPQFKMDMK